MLYQTKPKKGKSHTCVSISIKTWRIKRISWLQPLCHFNFGGWFPLLRLVGPSMDWRAFTCEEKDILRLMTVHCALALYVYSIWETFLSEIGFYKLLIIGDDHWSEEKSEDPTFPHRAHARPLSVEAGSPDVGKDDLEELEQGGGVVIKDWVKHAFNTVSCASDVYGVLM